MQKNYQNNQNNVKLNISNQQMNKRHAEMLSYLYINTWVSKLLPLYFYKNQAVQIVYASASHLSSHYIFHRNEP